MERFRLSFEVFHLPLCVLHPLLWQFGVRKVHRGTSFLLRKTSVFYWFYCIFSVSSMLFEAFKRKKLQISVTLEGFEIVGLCCQEQHNKLIYSNLSS